MNELHYRMKWGMDVILLTLVTVLILLGVLVFPCLRLASTSVYVTMGAIGLIIGVVMLYAPLAMGCTSRGVYVRRIKGTLVIPYADIRSLEIVDASDVMHLRLMGSGGFMGYFGLFSSRRLGRFVLYASERKGLVYIETVKRKYVVSCPEPEAFIALCNQYRQK